jgi:hypothetical protein
MVAKISRDLTTKKKQKFSYKFYGSGEGFFRLKLWESDLGNGVLISVRVVLSHFVQIYILSCLLTNSLKIFEYKPMERVLGSEKKDEGDISRKKARHVKGRINLYSSPVIILMKQGV